MAFYSSNYQPPYMGNYDLLPSQVSRAYSSPEFRDQNFFEYNPSPYYYDAYESGMNHSVIAYSISTISVPKSVVYDPYSSGDYNPASNLFRVSYPISNSEFNEPEFEEYDPTPYGGGYDPALTYGKPLPPSDDLCYPRSKTGSTAVPIDGVSLGSRDSPYGKEDVDESAAKPHIEIKPAPTNEDERKKEYENNNLHDSSSEKPLERPQGEDVRETPWPNRGSRSNECNNYEYDMGGTQIPPGYGLEAMDLCESIFGYWPCLARYNRRGHNCEEIGNCESSSSSQWKQTADYLFGSSNPYDERRGGESYYGYGDPICNHERQHYQEQPLYRQVEYDGDSWMHKLF